MVTMSNQQKPATEHTLDAQLKPFFQAWNSYRSELRGSIFKYVFSKKTQPEPLLIIPRMYNMDDGKAKERFFEWGCSFSVQIIKAPKIPQELSSEKFTCLETIDKVFGTTIKPILERFFEMYPLIHEGRGEPKAVELYNNIIKAGENLNIIKYWWFDPYFDENEKELLPPRVTLPRRLESEKDVFEGIEEYRRVIHKQLFSKWLEERPQLSNQIIVEKRIDYFAILDKWMDTEVVAYGFWNELLNQWEVGKETIHTIINWANSQKENLKELRLAEKDAGTGKEGIGSKNVNMENVTNSNVIIQIDGNESKQEDAIDTGKHEKTWKVAGRKKSDWFKEVLKDAVSQVLSHWIKLIIFIILGLIAWWTAPNLLSKIKTLLNSLQ